MMKFADRCEDRLPRSMIQVARRFVRQQERGIADQSPGDCHPLLLATGKLSNLMMKPMPKLKPLQHPLCRIFDLVAGFASNQPGHYRVFQGRELRQQMMKLKDKTNVPISKPGQLLRSPIKNILVVKENASPCRRIQTTQKVK